MLGKCSPVLNASLPFPFNLFQKCLISISLTQLRDLQDQLKEISLRRRRLVCDLVGQHKVMQQREAAEIRTLQAKLDNTHHVAATQVQALKQVVIQTDNEIADAEQSLKGKLYLPPKLNADNCLKQKCCPLRTHTHTLIKSHNQALGGTGIPQLCRFRCGHAELRVRCERLVESFVKLLNETLEMMEKELAAPLLQKLHTTEQFTAKVESYKAEFIAKIDAFFAEKEEQQPLGAAWRGMGLVPPSVVTKLDL